MSIKNEKLASIVRFYEDGRVRGQVNDMVEVYLPPIFKKSKLEVIRNGEKLTLTIDGLEETTFKGGDENRLSLAISTCITNINLFEPKHIKFLELSLDISRNLEKQNKLSDERKEFVRKIKDECAEFKVGDKVSIDVNNGKENKTIIAFCSEINVSLPPYARRNPKIMYKWVRPLKNGKPSKQRALGFYNDVLKITKI